MAVGFGFSMGDLVTGLQDIKDSIAAVKDGKGASADYAGLLIEIKCLQDAFEGIEGLRLDLNGSEKQRGAIDRAVAVCQKCIDDFIASISNTNHTCNRIILGGHQIIERLNGQYAGRTMLQHSGLNSSGTSPQSIGSSSPFGAKRVELRNSQ